MSIEIRISGSNASDPDAKNKNNVKTIGDVAAELFRFRSALSKQSPAQFAPVSVFLKRYRGYTVRQESNPRQQAENKSDCHRRFQNYEVKTLVGTKNPPACFLTGGTQIASCLVKDQILVEVQPDLASNVELPVRAARQYNSQCCTVHVNTAVVHIT